MGRKRQKLRSDADDRASVYAGYQRRGKNYCRPDWTCHYFQGTADESGQKHSFQNRETK